MILLSFFLFAVLLGAVSAAGSLDAPIIALDQEKVDFDARQLSKLTQALDRQLISISLEFCNIVDFLGDVNQPNEFSKQLLQNVADRAGGLPPLVRLGGNTQDRSTFCEECADTLFNYFEPGDTEAVNTTFNKNLFRVLDKNLGPNQRYIFGLNFGREGYEAAEAEILAASSNIDQSRIDAYELGNEPNWFVLQKHRKAPWGILDYAKESIEWMPRLQQAAGRGFPGFQFGAIAEPPAALGNFTETQLAMMKVHQHLGKLKYISTHGYAQKMCNPSQAAGVNLEYFLNHLSTIEFLHRWETEFAVAKNLGLRVHVGETNTVGCHGKDGVSNTLGALLWFLDYSLYGASIGVDRFFFHNGKGEFWYSMWEPLAINETTPAHINPTYYSMLFHADLVSDLHRPRIARISHLDSRELAHYAIYDGFSLEKIVIINTAYYYGTGERPVKTSDFSVSLGKKLKVRRLTGPAVNAKIDISWSGQEVNGEGKLKGELIAERVTDGLVTIKAGEAVIVQRGG